MSAEPTTIESLPLVYLAGVLRAMDEAMKAEGVHPVTMRRIKNRVVWGHPDGDSPLEGIDHRRTV